MFALIPNRQILVYQKDSNVSTYVSGVSQWPSAKAMRPSLVVPPRQIMNEFGNGEGWGSGSFVYLRFNVQDTGCGLSPQQISLLFEKFAQAVSKYHVSRFCQACADLDPNTKTPRTHMQYGGSGLGLFISRQLAELHGGQIGVSSQAGVGSIFGFYLKCKRMVAQKPKISGDTVKHALEAEQAVSSRTIIDAAAVQTPAKPTTADQEDKSPAEAIAPQISIDKKYEGKDDRLHVLVVEDNIVNQKVLVKQLTKVGCIVHTADNGVWALKQLAKTIFCVADGIPLNIVLMDCEMPEMDGLTCCRKIREMEQRKEITRHVPIIAVTANIRGGQMDDAKEAGMDDVVGKPFRIPDLLAKMKDLLKKTED
jgi:CheY-like chemotaxis protein